MTHKEKGPAAGDNGKGLEGCSSGNIERPQNTAPASPSQPATRERLPNRRESSTFNFLCGPHRYTATISYFPGTDRLAEIFLSNGRAGSDVDAAAKDSAVVASLALQAGISVDTIRKALLRDPRNVASSPLGIALDLVAGSS